ncbi:hypothetical protein ACJX0J_020603, partial [Zea mays]
VHFNLHVVELMNLSFHQVLISFLGHLANNSLKLSVLQAVITCHLAVTRTYLYHYLIFLFIFVVYLPIPIIELVLAIGWSGDLSFQKMELPQHICFSIQQIGVIYIPSMII